LLPADRSESPHGAKSYGDMHSDLLPSCHQKLTELLPKIDASRAYLMKDQANKQRIW
jgi:hypothetical protein